jgi:predicted phage terminase large subunit-like protein
MPVTIDDIKSELVYRRNEVLCEQARRDFYTYCQIKAPKFYIKDRLYLKEYCNILQKLYEGRLLKENGKAYKKLIVQMPPRFGKTRTLTLFNSWIFGRNNQYKIMCAAYNDSLANQFSKFTRNIITEIRQTEDQIIYNDVFPDTKIQHGSAAAEVWALEGSFFSYRGSGINGTITGVGANLLIIDDPIKSAEEAYNEEALNKIWLWYTSTWLSRGEGAIESEIEQDDYEPLEIITNTPWAKRDIAGRLLDSEFASDWYVFNCPACIDEAKQIMLCDKILSWDRYYQKSLTVDEFIFAANYKMKRLDIKGLLYKEFKTYKQLPDMKDKNFKGRMMIADTADKGEDYFTAVFGVYYDNLFFVTDIIYTQDDIDKTEEKVALKMFNLKIQIAHIEDNGAGHNYSYIIRKSLKTKHGYECSFQDFTTSKNKQARIFSRSIDVNNIIIFPENWKYQFPEFYTAITEYSRIGKNKHDDAPDCLTSVVERAAIGGTFSEDFRKRMAARNNSSYRYAG